LEDHRISAKSIAEQLGISRERVVSIINEDLDMLLACFLPGRAKDLPAPLYLAGSVQVSAPYKAMLQMSHSLFVTSGPGARAPGCTAAITLIVRPVFWKFPLSPSDVRTSYATRDIQAARGRNFNGR
jgi:hypothetical protein